MKQHLFILQISEVIQRLARKLDLLPTPVGIFRKAWLQLRGAQIAASTNVPRLLVTWPHQVRIGEHCILQPDIFFNYDHYWNPGPSIRLGDRVFVGRGVEFNIQGSIDIGDQTLIASGCVFVDHDHGTDTELAINVQPNLIKPITIGRNVWLGANCVVLKGVTIGDGAIVGAASVVTKSIPSREVWVGSPVRKIR